MQFSFSAFLMTLVFIFSINLINSEESSSKMIFSLIWMIMIMCLFLYNHSKSSWMSISLFLSLVGGLMILFTLVASIYPKSLNSSFQSFLFLMVAVISLPLTNFTSNGVKNIPIYSFSYKMQFILMIILILNFMLIFISKLVISPIKPFRSS